MSLDEVEALARSIAATPWFSKVGRPLDETDRARHAAYVAALDLAPGALAAVATWAEAGARAADPAWDRGWWAIEAGEQRRLQAAVEARHGAEAALAALTRVAEAALDPTRRGAEAAADEALARAAAGAAALACHTAALALAAGEAGHGFLLKHRLFAAGRWPLGRIGERWYLF